MRYPLVALRGLNIFPGMVVQFDVMRRQSVGAVKDAVKNGGKIFAVTQLETDKNEINFDSLYHVGTIAVIRQITKLSNNRLRVLAEGISRGRLVAADDSNKNLVIADVCDIVEDDGHISDDSEYETAAFRVLVDMLGEFLKYYPKAGQNLSTQVESTMPFREIINRIASNIPIPYDKKQDVLQGLTTKEQYEKLSLYLREEAEIAALKFKLTADIKKKVNKNQKEFILKEQMAAIRKELSGEEDSEAESFLKRLDMLNASDEIKTGIRKEINRFSHISESSSEGAVQRGYIETLLELPWNKVSKDNTDINNAEKILDEDHFGLTKVKERILEYLSVRALTDGSHAPILCLVGPPGTGKTSIAKSMARALDREYVRICLGGVRDEAEIRGHRRTYVGAMPGRIAAGLRTAGTANPLMLLDEIDKVSNDYKGDTFSALLEVLDPDQNVRFRDHYVELPIDLSGVMFLATANDTSNIPRPLLDRMEVIEVSGYTANEKFHIAKEHLLKKQYEANGMNRKMLGISDGAIRDIIRFYTREAGVRELERKLGQVFRKSAREILSNEDVYKISVKSSNLDKYLGKHKYQSLMAGKKDEIGIVRGLAWTAVGGETLEIEALIMPGKGELKLTGKMGDVMKESATIALSFVRSISEKYDLSAEMFMENDFHIHIPEGAVPKDGPSAGITMATAILSAVTDRPVKAKTAMTGELTLRGNVLAIGGLKEKLLAAKMAGITDVLVPYENEKDVLELSEEITDGLNITYVRHMSEVIKNAFA